MIYILNIETTGVNCSVSVALNGETIVLKEINTGNFSHNEKLHLFIEEILKETHLSRRDFKAVAVSSGPGSYTGLRIGVSSAKGICFAWDLPLISVSTLQILAKNNPTKTDFIIPMLDARRMEVYTSVFNFNLEEISPKEAKILDENAFLDYLAQGKCVFLGDGSEKFSKICQHSNAIFLKEEFPSAKNMEKFSFEKFLNQDFENLAYFEPFYLKNWS